MRRDWIARESAFVETFDIFDGMHKVAEDLTQDTAEHICAEHHLAVDRAVLEAVTRCIKIRERWRKLALLLLTLVLALAVVVLVQYGKLP